MDQEAKKVASDCERVETYTTPFFTAASEVLAIFVFLGGCAVLLGWALDIPDLKSVFPGFVTMKANTALCFVLLGASLWLLQIQRRNNSLFQIMAGACGLIVSGVGLLTFLEYLFGWDLGIDQILFEELPGAILTASPGRMAFNTAINFTTLGVAFFLLASKIKNGYLFAQTLLIPAGIITILAFIGYLFRADPLFLGPHFSTAMALHTVLLFLLAITAALFCRPGCGFMLAVSSDAVGGKIIRRFLPVTILLPMILGWLKLWGERSGVVSNEFGVSFVATSNLIFITLYVYFLSCWLNKVDAERKRTEDLLRSSEAFLDSIFEHSPSSAWISDDKGTLIRANRALRDNLHVANEDLVGRYNVFQDKLVEEQGFMPMVRSVFEKGETVRFTMRYDSSQLQQREVRQPTDLILDMTISPVQDARRRVTNAIIQYADITERKKAEEVFKKLSEAKSRFATMVSHELRSPLATVKAATDLVWEGAEGAVNAEQKDLLGIAKENIDRLGRLINNVLDFQKIEAGKMEYDLRENDINQAVEEVHKSMSILSKRKNLDFQIKLGKDLPKIKSDRDKIIQVLMNLVSNAIKNTSTGSVTVETQKENNAVHVRVRDTGKGIPEEDIQRIFTPFERIGHLQKQEKGGTGLGLSISREIILKHHGKIWAESEMGSGTTLHFTLPL